MSKFVVLLYVGHKIYFTVRQLKQENKGTRKKMEFSCKRKFCIKYYGKSARAVTEMVENLVSTLLEKSNYFRQLL